jgi:hypothetical protein
VLQDAAEDEPTASVSTYNEMYSEVDARGHDQAPPYLMVDEPHDFRPGGPAPWMEFFPHPEPWEQENMGMGIGGAPMHAMGVHAGPHMGVEGPGPFPLGSGMPMGPPGPDFGMYPGGPFGPPPVVRYYSSLYNGLQYFESVVRIKYPLRSHFSMTVSRSFGKKVLWLELTFKLPRYIVMYHLSNTS